jgi:hypothetical protein
VDSSGGTWLSKSCAEQSPAFMGLHLFDGVPVTVCLVAHGGLGGVLRCASFRLSVRARERDWQPGDLSPGLSSRLKVVGGLDLVRDVGRRPGRRHRMTHKRGVGRLLLPTCVGKLLSREAFPASS